MKNGWKQDLPSDQLLRENPHAYDSSPMPSTRSALEFTRGYKPWQTGGSSASKTKAIIAPQKPARELVTLHGMTLRKGVCAICEQSTGLTTHHLTPKQVRHLTTAPSRTARICFPCHKSLHRRFTNRQLLNVPWEDVVASVREMIAAAATPHPVTMSPSHPVS